MTLALLMLQPPASWNLRAIDILTTILLTVLIGLSTWALKTVLSHAERFETVNKSLSTINQQLWGVDGKNGHASEIRDIKRSFRRIERYILKLDYRIQRVEEQTGHPSGEHARFERDPDGDQEDDQRD